MSTGPDDPDPLLTAGDFRGAFCMAGVRQAILEAGLDYTRFLDTGLPASTLYGRGYDAMVDRVMANRKAR